MRVQRAFAEGDWNILDLDSHWGRRQLYMMHANGAYTIVRYVGDCPEALDAVRANISGQACHLERAEPPTAPVALYSLGDECYRPFIDNNDSPGAREFLASVWIFIDPVPRSEVFPARKPSWLVRLWREFGGQR